MADPFKVDDLEVTNNVDCTDVVATGDVGGDSGTFTTSATVGGVGVALRATELDQATGALGAPFTSSGGGAWEAAFTVPITLSLDGGILAVASFDAEAAAAAAVMAEFRLTIDGNAGGEIGADLLATQDAIPGSANHMEAGLTAGAINAVLEVKDDGVTAVTVSRATISAIGLVQK